jgi:hypothetical protein
VTAGQDPDAARLLDQLADPLDQLVAVGEAEREIEQVCAGLERAVTAYLDERLEAAAAVLRRELVDPERVLRAGLAAWARGFAQELEGGGEPAQDGPGAG